MDSQSPIFFDADVGLGARTRILRSQVLDLANETQEAIDRALIVSERDFLARAHNLLLAIRADADAMLERIEREQDL